MRTIRATLIDADYITKEGNPIIRLILKKKRFFRLYDDAFEPYFYLDCEDRKAGEKAVLEISVADMRGEKVGVKRVEEVELMAMGKKKAMLKVVCRHPGHVPLLRDRIVKLGRIYEYDIPFARRYLMDRKISPFDEVEAECAGKLIKAVKKVGEGSAELRTAAFDIETYNPRGEPDATRDPVVMISHANGKGQVITSREVKGADFVNRVKGEREMIDAFCAYLKEKDVEVLVGYNSSVFDLPYLKTRAQKTGTKLVLGRDGSDFSVKKRGLNEVARIIGRIHVDLYFVTRFLGIIGAIKTPQYTLKETYAEIMGKPKEKTISKLDVWKLWDDEKGRQELADYSLNDAVATKELADRLIPMEVELSRICGATLFDIVGATASQLVEMLLMRRSGEKGMLIPNRPGEDEMRGRMEPVKGAYVKMPQAGIYDNLAVLDFRGLYPSLICAYNIDPFTLVKKEKGAEKDGKAEKGRGAREEGEQEGGEEKDVYVSPAGHAFSKSRKGIVPAVLEEILDKRAEVKKELRKWETKPDSSEYRQLYAISQALKVIAN
ncbi:DNA polymerase [Candidatus Burarchaeum australiense]|nr:DNA polymerase [Candidatus Burarchaeum australiense]